MINNKQNTHPGQKSTNCKAATSLKIENRAKKKICLNLN
jgi:hypothetical protein